MTPSEHLERLLTAAQADPARRDVSESANWERLAYVCGESNRAGVRLLMSCLLAKIDNPNLDPRKPYTEIGTADSFSGRDAYDQPYVAPFVQTHRLPCNPTTAFLTPVLRNINQPLSPSRPLVGRPRRLYADAVQLLEEVAEGRETAEAILTDLLRILVRMRDERIAQLAALEAKLREDTTDLPLSSEDIVTLISQHLRCKKSSRLPVLIVAAAYEAVAARFGERYRPLHGHNAADKQTGAAGDVEITLVSDDQVRTVYEMKQKAVTVEDIEIAVEKFAGLAERVDNYIFITTAPVVTAVAEYAAKKYDMTGVEVVILDCLGFLRHFLHLFHRHRATFLDAYQRLVLAEPDSAVSLPLKEVFLILRRQAEAEA
jgi:hypothetical protein